MNKYLIGSAVAAATVGLGGATAILPTFAEAPDCSAVATQSQLVTCIDANMDITLGGNIELDKVIVIKGEHNIKIDLNSYNITRNGNSAAFQIRNGSLALEGNGMVERTGVDASNSKPTIRVYGSTELDGPFSSLIIGKDVTIKNNDDAAIGIDGNDAGSFHNISVALEGKATGKYGIRTYSDINSYLGLPLIDITDGAIIEATSQAIRAEGPAQWTIQKAEITGGTGIALRAGRFYLDGPTVTANGPDEAYIHYFALDKSGDNPCDPETSCKVFPESGAAIQIQEEQTDAEDGINDIEIFISGGSYVSKYGYAISEYKEREENHDPAILTDTMKTFRITEGDLRAFTDIDEVRKEILKNETRYDLYMVTDDFSWRFDGGRMCADGSAAIKSYDEDWLRTNFIIRKFGKIQGLAAIYQGLPWIERLLVDYTSFPGPYTQYDFSDGKNVALDIYAESKGKKYEDIPILKIADIDLYRFEKDGIDLEIEGEQGYFRGSLTTPGDYELEGNTGKPYTIIHDTEIYPLTLTLKLPEDIPTLAEGYTREYYMLDFHCTSDGTEAGGEVCDIIELPTTMSEDGTEYTFTTTKFSTFVLTYEDKKIPLAPNTGAK